MRPASLPALRARPTCGVGRGRGRRGGSVFGRELQVRRKAPPVVGQGLGRQLHVPPEHSQGGVSRHRIEAHVHQLGENTGWATRRRPPSSAPVHPLATENSLPGNMRLTPGMRTAPASCPTALQHSVCPRRPGGIEEACAQHARAWCSQKGSGLVGWRDVLLPVTGAFREVVPTHSVRWSGREVGTERHGDIL